MTDSQKDLVLHLLQRGNWSDAIVAYCEETGADSDAARAYVRQLAAEHQINPSRKWWLLGWTMLASGVIVATAWILPS